MVYTVLFEQNTQSVENKNWKKWKPHNMIAHIPKICRWLNNNSKGTQLKSVLQ